MSDIHLLKKTRKFSSKNNSQNIFNLGLNRDHSHHTLSLKVDMSKTTKINQLSSTGLNTYKKKLTFGGVGSSKTSQNALFGSQKGNINSHHHEILSNKDIINSHHPVNNFNYKDFIHNLEMPKFELDLSPLNYDLPYNEILLRLKENNKFLFEITNEEKHLNDKIKSFNHQVVTREDNANSAGDNLIITMSANNKVETK
jgi:hypothetical protein